MKKITILVSELTGQLNINVEGLNIYEAKGVLLTAQEFVNNPPQIQATERKNTQ